MHDEGDVVLGGRECGRAAVDRQLAVDHCLGGHEQRLALVVGEPRVDGHRGGAEQQAGVQRDREVHTWRHRDPHAVAAAHAAPGQGRGGAAGALQQIRVRQSRAIRLESDPLGPQGGGALQPWFDRHRRQASGPIRNFGGSPGGVPVSRGRGPPEPGEILDEATSVFAVTVTWTPAADYEDIRYETSGDGIAKITIDRPEVRNAFRPQTIIEISDALERAREDTSVGVIVLTGEGPLAFCSGGDQRVRGDTGYLTEGAAVGRFHVTDLHVQIRRLPKPVVAMVAGYAVGGGHVLHLVCDLTIAADNARFGQTGPRVGSFDGGFGAGLLANLVGPKKAKEIWFLCRQYDAQQALEMGLVNTVVPLEDLEAETVKWCREMLELSPFSLRLLKASFHAAEDGLSGIQQLAHDANLLFYASEEAQEGREAYKAKRKPDFSQFPRRP